MISVYLLLDYFRKGKSQQRRSEWRFLLIPQTQSADKLRRGIRASRDGLLSGRA